MPRTTRQEVCRTVIKSLKPISEWTKPYVVLVTKTISEQAIEHCTSQPYHEPKSTIAIICNVLCGL